MDITLDFNHIDEGIKISTKTGSETVVNFTLTKSGSPYTPKEVLFDGKYREHGKYRGNGKGTAGFLILKENAAKMTITPHMTLKPTFIDCVLICDDEVEYPFLIDVED